MARIVFKAVTKRYAGDVLAVRDLNLEIRDKEFVVLLGPSGCGKSTTLNMIAGLEEVTDGELWFDDQVVNALPPHRRDVAMVFQSYALYPHKSVYENIAFGLRMRKIPKPEIDARVQGCGPEARHLAPAAAAAEPALRRAAPARGAGARHGAPARRVPHGRAAVQPRRRPAHLHARRDQAPAHRDADHLRLRHARPGRGADAGRSHRRHERRRHPADRNARRDLRAPAQHLRRLVPGQSADQLPAGRDRERRRQGGVPPRGDVRSAAAGCRHAHEGRRRPRRHAGHPPRGRGNARSSGPTRPR